MGLPSCLSPTYPIVPLAVSVFPLFRFFFDKASVGEPVWNFLKTMLHDRPHHREAFGRESCQRHQVAMIGREAQVFVQPAVADQHPIRANLFGGHAGHAPVGEEIFGVELERRSAILRQRFTLL